MQYQLYARQVGEMGRQSHRRSPGFAGVAVAV
jgi:hypothetical protein